MSRDFLKTNLKTGRRRVMFYVTDCISGIIDGVTPWKTLEEAKEYLAQTIEEDGDEELWIIVDDDGNEYA